MIYVTADLHLRHPAMVRHRPFDTIAEHDETIIRNWNKAISDNDEVFLLGDLTLHSWREILPLASQLNGIIYLVTGNHDQTFPGARNGHKKVKDYMKVFDAVVQSARINFNGTKYLLSHFPYEGDRGQDRHVQWRLPDLGAPLIHGHTHSTEQLSFTENGTPQYCVSVDAWDFKPVSMTVIDKKHRKVVNEQHIRPI